MFVRVKKIGAYEYLYLVENVREGGRHVQRVVKALGRKDEIVASGMLDGLVASAARHSQRSIVLSRFYRGELAEHSGAPAREAVIVPVQITEVPQHPVSTRSRDPGPAVSTAPRLEIELAEGPRLKIWDISCETLRALIRDLVRPC